MTQTMGNRKPWWFVRTQGWVWNSKLDPISKPCGLTCTCSDGGSYGSYWLVICTSALAPQQTLWDDCLAPSSSVKLPRQWPWAHSQGELFLFWSLIYLSIFSTAVVHFYFFNDRSCFSTYSWTNHSQWEPGGWMWWWPGQLPQRNRWWLPAHRCRNHLHPIAVPFQFML